MSIEPEAKGKAAVLSAVRASPLVDIVAAATALPLDMKWPSAVVAGDSALVDAIYNRVTASYFDVLGIGVIGGRALTREDEDGGDACGRRQRVGGATPVAARESARPRVETASARRHRPIRSSATRTRASSASCRTSSSVPSKTERMRRCSTSRARSNRLGAACSFVREGMQTDRSARWTSRSIARFPVASIGSTDSRRSWLGAIYPFRVAYWVALILGLIALTLTVVGVYGVVAYLVGQRTREIGIRVALGATTGDVLALVMRQSVRQAVIGTAIGLSLALGLARVIAANVPGIPAFDRWPFWPRRRAYCSPVRSRRFCPHAERPTSTPPPPCATSKNGGGDALKGLDASDGHSSRERQPQRRRQQKVVSASH